MSSQETPATVPASAGQTALGRPGNLTLEQEAKLRELWILSAKLFGIFTEADVPLVQDTQPVKTVESTTPTPSTAEPTKKRFGLFRRKKDDELPAAAPVPTSGPGWGSDTAADIAKSGSSGNDKHGQGALFQQAMANSTPEELRQAFWSMSKHDHPDGLFLRFLRARKWDVNAALVMAISALHWRLCDPKVDEDVLHLGEQGMIDWAKGADAGKRTIGNDFMEQLRMGKSFVHGVDKDGRPCCYIRVRLHHAGDQTEAAQERYTVYTIETARLMLKSPVDTATLIFDMTDFGLKNMDNAPVQFMIRCFEANYPESLGVVLVHKAPWVFQGVWRLIKGWLDPVVASKINFTNNLNDLSQFLAPESIIHDLGGPVPYEYKYIEPVAGENDAMKDTAKRTKLEQERKELAAEYEQSIREWALLPTTDTAGWDKQRARRNEISEKLKLNYWQLDPLVRARSLYDRNGQMPGSVALSGTTAEGTQTTGDNKAQGTDGVVVPPIEEMKKLDVA